MRDRADRRPCWPASAGLAALMVLAVAATGCSRPASVTAAAGHDARRFAAAAGGAR